VVLDTTLLVMKLDITLELIMLIPLTKNIHMAKANSSQEQEQGQLWVIELMPTLKGLTTGAIQMSCTRVNLLGQKERIMLEYGEKQICTCCHW